MPFCRKCGRRLPEYSESCTECGTSTTAPMVKVKKGPAVRVKAPSQTQTTKTFEPPVTIISLKPKAKPAKPAAPAKTEAPIKEAPPAKPIPPPRKVSAKTVPPPEPLAPLTIEPHEIKKSNVSLKEDIIKNPNDYEKQPFNFDLKCPNGHFYPEGVELPVSKGIAFCIKCGERLSKPKRKKKPRYHRY